MCEHDIQSHATHSSRTQHEMAPYWSRGRFASTIGRVRGRGCAPSHLGDDMPDLGQTIRRPAILLHRAAYRAASAASRGRMRASVTGVVAAFAPGRGDQIARRASRRCGHSRRGCGCAEAALSCRPTAILNKIKSGLRVGATGFFEARNRVCGQALGQGLGTGTMPYRLKRCRSRSYTTRRKGLLAIGIGDRFRVAASRQRVASPLPLI